MASRCTASLRPTSLAQSETCICVVLIDVFESVCVYPALTRFHLVPDSFQTCFAGLQTRFAAFLQLTLGSRVLSSLKSTFGMLNKFQFLYFLYFVFAIRHAGYELTIQVPRSWDCKSPPGIWLCVACRPVFRPVFADSLTSVLFSLPE